MRLAISYFLPDVKVLYTPSSHVDKFCYIKKADRGEKYLIQFRPMTTQAEAEQVMQMMAGLYQEDPASHQPDRAHFEKTITLFLQNPSRGVCYLFTSDDPADIHSAGMPAVLGYALVVPYWSNEFGGDLVFIDELFVSPQARGRGIARGFIQELIAKQNQHAAALALEVTPQNSRARKLYESMGFETRKNSVMIRRW